MQTRISEQFINTLQGQEANEILRSCVHCGFCTATCPTYQLLGDELDGPRGRIYLIKQVLEGNEVTTRTQTHLDRCLTCRSCETTCPSGVRYGRLLDIGRELVDKQVVRPPVSRFRRYILRRLLPYPKRVAPVLRLAGMIKPFLPADLKQKIPPQQIRFKQLKEPSAAEEKPSAIDKEPSAIKYKHSLSETRQLPIRKMLVLQGCIQSVTSPNTNQAAESLLSKLGIQLIAAPEAGCCGAVSHHLSAIEEGLGFMRNNIDAWWTYIEEGVEAIVITASGCGTMVKEYGQLLAHDKHYAEKAARISELAKDISEIVSKEPLSPEKLRITGKKVAFHSPCTLQHGQKLNGVVESILSRAGFELTPVDNPHLCCGSAGTYSILQAELSQQLLANKLATLEKNAPTVIATANIGCQLHMQTKAKVPVRHWVELMDRVIK
jgi:glycolate oxidase iron-sulfur subunit